MHGLYIQQLMEERKLTNVDIQHVLSLTSHLVTHTVEAKLAEVRGHLETHGCTQTVDFPAPTIDIFNGLETAIQQQKFFVEHFGLIFPIKIALPLRDADYCRIRTRQPEGRRQKYSITIPLFKQLQQILGKVEVVEHIERDCPVSTPGTLHGFEGGAAFHNN